MDDTPPGPLPSYQPPADGHLRARRQVRRVRRRALARGTWLQRAGAVGLVVMLVWFTVGDDVVGRWQQYGQRAALATTGQVEWDPTLYAPVGDPVFGFGGSAQAAQVALVALPGETLEPDTPTRPDQTDTSPEVATSGEDSSSADDQTADEPSGRDLTFRMTATTIGLDWAVGAGVTTQDLNAGPGWMRGTAVPGAGGNTVLAGHRTTYGAPFNRLDELADGDRIVLSMPGGTDLVYEVTDRFVVPSDVIEVAYPTDGSRLTLTTCTPTGTADYRLIVQAEQVAGPGTAPGIEFEPFTSDERLDDPALQR